MNINFFCANYLIDHRVEKNYRNFIEQFYGLNELNEHGFTMQSVLSLPYPLYNDFVEYQIKEKKKESERQQRELKIKKQ